MNPGDRPRKLLLALLGAVLTVGVVSALVVAVDTTPAAAGELERSASCDDVAAWAEPEAPNADDGSGAADQSTGAGAGAGTGGGEPDRAEAPVAATPGALAESGDAEGAATADGTNVVVEGVDELDLVDRLDDRLALVVGGGRLSIVDVVDHRIVAQLPVGSAVEATYDPDRRGVAWVVGPEADGGRLTAARVAVTPTSLALEGSWATDGWLVDARRVGDRLHLVAADGYGVATGAGAEDAIPFASGPVPCDQVLHPVGPSEPTATLLVSLPATGPVEPQHATEVVGSGELVHVTTEAAYLATPLYGDTVQTSIHRFDLADLRLTGSGRVDGSLLNEFSMSDHDGHLRVAISDGFGGGVTRAADTGVAMTEPAGDVAPSEVPPERGGDARNTVVVLDTAGTLDEVGRTPDFGHPGETLHGIRFDGDVAYAVTFLQTDPFYVLELDDPTAPRVVGEVELPGFSSYLHPVGDGLVAGFGPDDDGTVAARLFDVSDRSQPRVVDTISLGQESPVAWDHHAYVDLGDGRLAVPASIHREQRPAGCTPERQEQLRSEEARRNAEMERIYADGTVDPEEEAQAREVEAAQSRIYEEGCLYPNTRPESSVVVLEVVDRRLRVAQRLGAVLTDTSASRAVRTDDGWALLAGNRWVVLDGASGAQVADLELGPAEDPRPMPIEGPGAPIA